MACSCKKCYECSGIASKSGTCLCGSCDRCRRCCTKNILKCDSATFITVVSNTVGCAQSILGVSSFENLNKNYYDVFFKKIKAYVFFQKKKMNWYKNPLEDESFNFLKFEKSKKIINFDFDFKNKEKLSFVVENNNLKWSYEKQMGFYDFYNFNNKNKLNYLVWNGNSWITYRKNCDFNLIILNKKNPFFVIFDNNFNLIDTDNLEIKEKGLSVVIDYNNIKNILITNSENEIKKQNYYENVKNKSLVNCDYEPVCYSFATTIYPTDTDGCGICCPFVDVGNIFTYSVGGVCIARTDYNDKYVKTLGKKVAFIKDGYGFSVLFELTECAMQNGIAIETFSLLNYMKTCPCSFATYCNMNKKKCNYQYNSLGNRLNIDIQKIRKEYQDHMRINFKRSIR